MGVVVDQEGVWVSGLGPERKPEKSMGCESRMVRGGLDSENSTTKVPDF